MPRTCTVCAHPDRADIDSALVRGESIRNIASRYVSLSRPAIQRHSENHLPATLLKASEAEEVARADALLSEVRDLQDRALGILDRAENAGDLRTALGAIREARGNLELLAKLLGELNEAPTVNLHLSAEWIELRTLIVGALESHPEARGSVLRALEGASNGS